MAWEHASTFSLLPWLPLADRLLKVALESTVADGPLSVVRVLVVDLERGVYAESLSTARLGPRLRHESRSTVRPLAKSTAR